MYAKICLLDAFLFPENRCCHFTVSILISKPTGDSQCQSLYLLLSILTENSSFMEQSLHEYMTRIGYNVYVNMAVFEKKK